MNKLKLSYEGQINHLKSKGILFNKVSETKALEYLKLNNNFFKLKSYRKNFNKNKSKDQYVHLEFAYLSDLSIIDTRLRKLRIQMLKMVTKLCRTIQALYRLKAKHL